VTNYYGEGKQLSVKQFKTRIKKGERDTKEGRFYTAEEMKAEMEKWIEQKKATK
jgi:predicted transcriptional regulator